MAENLPKRPPHNRGEYRPKPVPEPPPAPGHLSAESAGHYVSAVTGWVIGADAIPLLQAACERWDAYVVARDVLTRDGPVIPHPTTGALQAHPAHAIMRDNLREWRLLWRQLGLTPPEAP